MIQFNLLPDVKKEYVKARKAKRLIMSSSLLVSAVSIGIVFILFSIVQFAQKKNISDLTKDIKNETSKIQETENLNTLLTVQTQLSLLPALHEGKPETSRIFSYIKFVSPEKVKVGSLSYDAVSGQLVLQGSADTIATINKFVDNIKAARYVIDGEEASAKIAPFTQVSTQLSGDNEKSSFKIELIFDSVIFDNTKDIIMSLGGESISTKQVGVEQ